MTKTFILFLISVAGYPTVACPNLSGRWNCGRGQNSWSVEVSQSTPSSGNAIYKFDEGFRTETYIADGNWYQINSADGDKLSIKSFCENSNFHLMWHNEYHNGEVVNGATKNFINDIGDWVADSEANGYPSGHTMCARETSDRVTRGSH